MTIEGWKLTAWALGELDGAEAEAVEAAVAADPELADEVTAVLGAAGYTTRWLDQVPRARVAAVAGATSRPAERTSTGPVAAVSELAARAKRARRPAVSWRPWAAGAVALAAAVALVVALSGGGGPEPRLVGPQPPIAPNIASATAEPTPETGRSLRSSPAPDPLLAASVPVAPMPVAEVTPPLLTSPEEPPALQGASTGPPEEEARGLILSVIVDPPDATLLASRGSVVSRGSGLYDVRGLADGDVVKLRVERDDGSGETREVRMAAVDRVERIFLAPAAPPEAPPKAPPVGPGAVAISASPWAHITVDGKPIGTTPKTVSLPSGRHVVTLTKGSAKTTRTVVVRPGRKLTVFHDFDANPF